MADRLDAEVFRDDGPEAGRIYAERTGPNEVAVHIRSPEGSDPVTAYVDVLTAGRLAEQVLAAARDALRRAGGD